MKHIDNFLNQITMYRLVLYGLIVLVVGGAVFCLTGLLPFNFFQYIISVLFLLSVSWFTNKIFAKTFAAPTNVESVYISTLILALIVSPAKSVHDLLFLFWLSILTNASKYILAINKKHIFNPVAIAVAITAYAINQSASWWVGTAVMLPLVAVTGFLIVRKIQRTDLVFSFLFVAMLTILIFGVINGNNILLTIQKVIADTPILFFAFIMLTEPLTTPPTKKLQIVYGTLVGFLFAPQIHFGNIYLAPETTLLIGNVFSYLVSPKEKLMLVLKEKIHVGPDIYDFIFALPKRMAYQAGQYMEWTLEHEKVDARGNRRYLTLASSPTENNLRIGVKYYPKPSSYKKSLLSMNSVKIIASQRAGDFVLPRDATKKLVFIAGGIGITPFRSMIKYLLDTNQKRQITLFYCNKNAAEIVYRDVFDAAQQSLNIKTVYVLTDKQNVPASWLGKIGRIDEQMIKEEVPDYFSRLFYLSGPHNMVTAFENTIRKMGVKKGRIIIDYFPGFA